MTLDLLHIVRTQLKRSRTLPTQIEQACALNNEDSLPGQASGLILRMEEYEQELLLSRFFTPDQEDRAACEPALPLAGLTSDQLNALMADLEAETLSFSVVLEARIGYCPIPPVVLRRHVRLLGLEAALLPRVANLISGLAGLMTDQERFMAMSLARRPVWHEQNGESLLIRCLEAMGTAPNGTSGTNPVAKIDFLTSFVRTYRCFHETDLRAGLISLVESYRIDQEHPTYNPRLETRQAESIRSHYCDESVKQFRVAMARAILEDLSSST
ncbi:MAG: hypothetical protein H7839_11750 [Magnetococcus sp. YQC-5]